MTHVLHTSRGAVTPVPLEVAVETLREVKRAAAVGVGAKGVQQIVIVVETTSNGEGPASLELAVAVRGVVAPQAIAAVWTIKKLPVDIRHNVKIDRTVLGRSMAKKLSGKNR